MHQPGEPSVEVILDSIKRVIARENRPFDGGRPSRGGNSRFGPADPPREEPDVEPADADEAAEVLELDEGGIVTPPLFGHAGDDASVIALDNPAHDHDGEEDLIAYDWAEPEGLGEADDGGSSTADSADARDSIPAAESEDQPLTRPDTRAAMRDNLAALSMLSTLSRERQARGLDDLSIDALARDLLRPMLAEWLDTNLPPMVERLVQAEIRRIVGEGG